MRYLFSHSYGGKRAFVSAVCYTTKAIAGRFRKYRKIQWNKVRRVVFVCWGNVCRSPYAENKFRALGANAVSAGLGADNGKPANGNAERAALRRGIDLSQHRASAMSDASIFSGDLLV